MTGQRLSGLRGFLTEFPLLVKAIAALRKRLDGALQRRVTYARKNRQTMTENQKQKIRLTYPCNWIYKIIGTDEKEMNSAVGELIRDRRYRISVSRSSAKAKYIALNVELTVESEAHRLVLYEELKAHPAIKVIL